MGAGRANNEGQNPWAFVSSGLGQWWLKTAQCYVVGSAPLESLHWLPLKFRIEFKILLLTSGWQTVGYVAHGWTPLLQFVIKQKELLSLPGSVKPAALLTSFHLPPVHAAWLRQCLSWHEQCIITSINSEASTCYLVHVMMEMNSWSRVSHQTLWTVTEWQSNGKPMALCAGVCVSKLCTWHTHTHTQKEGKEKKWRQPFYHVLFTLSCSTTLFTWFRYTSLSE